MTEVAGVRPGPRRRPAAAGEPVDEPAGDDPDAAAAGGRARPPRTLERWAPGLPPLVLLALAVAYFHLLLRHPGGYTVGGIDAFLFMWWLGWTPFALGHGLNPLVANYLGWPHGVNAMWNTAVTPIGVLAAPVTLTAGPIRAYALLLVLGPAVSGYAAYLVARRWSAARWPAVLAGVCYGFSPWLLAQTGHLNLTWVCLPPVMVWSLHRILVRQDGRAWRDGLLLGVLCAVQLLLSEEVLATSALVGALGAVGLALAHPRRVRAHLRYAGTALGVAAGAALLLAAGPLVAQFTGADQVHAQIQDPRSVAATTDLAAFLVPTADRAFAPAGALNYAGHFGPNLSEQGSYLGAPLLVLLIVAVVSTRRTAVRYFAGMAAACAVLALGPRLRVGGDVTGPRLPWAAALHVPLLRDALPARLAMYLWLFVALLLAAWLDEVRSRGWALRAVPLVLAPAAAITLLPVAAPAGPVSTPRFFRDARALAAIPAGSPVAVAPIPTPGFPGPMMWDAEAGMRFRLVGGYFVGPAADGHDVSLSGQVPAWAGVAASIAGGAPAPDPDGPVGRQVLDGSRQLGIRYWIVAPMAYDGVFVDFLSRALHEPARPADDVWIVPVPP